jgi:hypothetical protein
MKSVSQPTREKIHHLSDGSFWSRVLGDTEQEVELPREIGFSGEATAIPEIAWLLVDGDGALWRAAVEAVHRLLETLAPMDLAVWDQRVREVGSYDREVNRR